MRKRVLSLLLTAALAAALLAAPGSGAEARREMNLTDVPETAWYYPYVKDLYESGIVDGFEDNTYRGEESIAWGQAFKLITLAIGCQVPEPVEGKHWAYPYIQLARDNRLLKYYFDEDWLEWHPTRLQVAQMVARALDLLSIPRGESPFADCDDGYVTHLYEKGILVGEYDEAGQLVFLPEEEITRAEITTIIWRMYHLDVTEGTFRHSNYWVEPFGADQVAPFGYDTAQFTLDENGFVTYGDDPEAYEVGVDVSEHQGEIDWQAVAEAGIDFAIIRIGGRLMQSGTIFEDKYFRANLEGAKAAGLKVGVYFFSQALNAQEGLEEAEFVLGLLDGVEHLGGNTARTYGVEPAEITAGIDAFCARVEEAGYRGMLYFNAYCGYIKMDLRELTDYDFWYAQYSDVPSYRYHFQMWQYSSSGQVDGIDSDVDLNLCLTPYGT